MAEEKKREENGKMEMGFVAVSAMEFFQWEKVSGGRPLLLTNGMTK